MGEWSSLPLMVAAVFVVIDLLTTQIVVQSLYFLE